MRNDRVVLDSWAWVEILNETAVGRRLFTHYVMPRRAVTPAMAVAEIAARAHRHGHMEEADAFVKSARIRTHIHPMDDDIAALAGQLVAHLKKRERGAGLADAIMLATARTLGLPLISRDPCFKGCADVRPE